MAGLIEYLMIHDLKLCLIHSYLLLTDDLTREVNAYKYK